MCFDTSIRHSQTVALFSTELLRLSDAYAQAGSIDGFQQKLKEFRLRYSNRPGMLRRIEKL